MKDRMVKYLKWLLPVCFIVYYSSISMFMHAHIEHGTTIVHAHPFKKTPDGGCHHHSSLSEIQLFHFLSTVQVEDGVVHPLQLHFYLRKLFNLLESPVSPEHLHPIQGKLSLRAPPALC